VLRAHTPKLDRDKEGNFWFTLGRPSTLATLQLKGNARVAGSTAQ
jgi:hypothetical protein